MGNGILVFIFLSGAREVMDILSAWAPKTVYILEIQFVIILTSYIKRYRSRQKFCHRLLYCTNGFELEVFLISPINFYDIDFEEIDDLQELSNR